MLQTLGSVPSLANSLYVDRTSELRKKGYQGRRLGPVQMTTDTAVRVTRICVQDKGTSSMLVTDASFGGCEMLMKHSTRRPDPIHRPPRSEDQQEREHTDAVSLCQGQRWTAYYARGTHCRTCNVSEAGWMALTRSSGHA